MTAQELKNAILQLAVQGKLVPQNPEDEPASELLKKILKEKSKLVKEGKIKKEKPLPEIDDEEIPFEIPESWAWVRLGEVYNVIMGQSPAGGSVTSNQEGVEFHQGKIRFSRCIIQESMSYTSQPTKIAPANSVLLCVRAPVGKVNITNREICIGRGLSAIVSFCKNTPILFTFYLLQTLEPVFNKLATGSTFKAISNEIISQTPIPLPPLAEQKRIVEKIEELLPLVERYGTMEEELQRLNMEFPEQLRKSILQQAVQGKLVPQDPADGTAEELLKKIRKEKDKLVREEKIKKEKPLPPITEDEIPFEIPESWVWVRLGEIGNWHAGATPPRENKDFYNGNIPWLKTGDLTDSYITGVSEFITDLALEKCSLQINPIGSVLIAMYGATIGKLGITKIPLTTNQACCACMPYTGIYNRYLFYYLMAIRKTFISMSMGGAQPNISKVKIVHTILPLPPLAEQKRIVEKIESLLPLCEELKQ